MSLILSNTVLGNTNAKHLLRRSCFHYSNEVLENISIMTPSEAIQYLGNESPNIWVEPYDHLPID
jgi:flagellar motor switch protein FliG